MDTTYLEQRWSTLIPDKIPGYRAIRISDDSINELYLGINAQLKRCLILCLPKGKHPHYPDDIKEYISLEYFDLSSHIIIKLIDDNFRDLFNDLIISIYQRIRLVESDIESAQKFIKTYYKWGEFFNSSISKKLSKEEIQGLFGELFVLGELIKDSKAESVNEILKSWQGPYDRTHDFIQDTKDIEVKTLEIPKIDVRISSEYQLDSEPGKGLDLQIVSVEMNSENSISIRQLVNVLKELISDRLGDISILLKALAKKNISATNIFEYDNYRFEIKTISLYNCLAEGFPRLINSNIPSETNSLKYNLRVNLLTDFMVSQKVY